MGVLMAVTVAVTMLGLVYLTQTLGTSATSSEIYYLEQDRADLIKDTKRLQIRTRRMTEAEIIIPKAQKQGLKHLGDIVVLTAP